MTGAGVRAFVVVCALAGALGGDVSAGSGATSASRATWVEIGWPFPIDQWGRGRAFRCAAAACGGELTLYIRPKLGFCNCTTGVADDAEVERVADIELLGGKFTALADGRPVKVGWMNGRSRPYAIESARGARRAALAVAFNDKCDVVVATVLAERALPRGADAAALDLLNSETVLRWAAHEIGI
jgi:hypothetical protein